VEANEGWSGTGHDAGPDYYFYSVSGTKAQLNDILSSLEFKTNGPSSEGAANAAIGEDGFGIFGTSDSTPNFFANPNGRLYFGYDDNGANEDDNHDDMIVSMEFLLLSSAETVPEPATLAIWGLGLGIAGLVRLRRRQTAV
jgi:hypothetical protein